MLNTPFAPWPCFTQEEGNAVRDVILSNRVNYWTGTHCREFETEFAQWVDVPHAVALANGTLALDVALKALGVGPGDEVIVTPRTFIASISCVVTAGAIPVFADIESDSGNLSAQTIERVLSRRTKAVICVHLAGWPCDMDPIMAMSEQHGFAVIEDCAQAHGARYKGRSVGSIGHVGAWSFCQDKIMTTGGEGGMVTTRDPVLWSRMWSYKDHGKSFEAVYRREHPPGFRWLHDSFGTNWRMMEMQAVLGRLQLKRMAEWTARRTVNAMSITASLEPFCTADGPVRVPRFEEHHLGSSGESRHAYYKFYAYVRPERIRGSWTRDSIIKSIVDAGVPCYQGSCSEVYLEKAFDGTGYRPIERLTNAKMLGETSIMFLVHPTLTDRDVEKSCEVISGVFERVVKDSL